MPLDGFAVMPCRAISRFSLLHTLMDIFAAAPLLMLLLP